MTLLSPQAQKIFWAFNEAASGKPDDWHYLPAIAAAIREAADQCTYVARTELNAIADELEAFGATDSVTTSAPLEDKPSTPVENQDKSLRR